MGPVQRRLLGDLARVTPSTTLDCPLYRLPIPSLYRMQAAPIPAATGYKHEERLHMREVPLPSVYLGQADPETEGANFFGKAQAYLVLRRLPRERALLLAATSRHGAELQGVAH